MSIAQAEISALAKAFAPMVRDYLAEAIAPLIERVQALEAADSARHEDERARAQNETRNAEAARQAMTSAIDVVRAQFADAQAPLKTLPDRVAALEARAPEKGDKGDPGLPGKDADTGSITAAVREACASAVEAIGKQIEIDDAKLDSQIAKKIADRLASLKGEPGARGADGPGPTDEQVGIVVAKHLAANPPPAGRDGADGKDGERGSDGRDGAIGERGAPGLQGAPGEDGRDGRDGVDGEAGLPGKDGASGAQGAPGEDGRDGRDGQAGIPGAAGRDGKDGADGMNGKNGADGLGFDDMSAELAEDGRTVTLRFASGEKVKEFPLPFPVVLDRGVYKDTGTYAKGDGVTFGGSFWVAQRSTSEKPDTSDAWRLCVKKGRDAPSKPFVPPQGPVRS